MKIIAWALCLLGAFIALFTDNDALAACDIAAGCFFLLLDIGDRLEKRP